MGVTSTGLAVVVFLRTTRWDTVIFFRGFHFGLDGFGLGFGFGFGFGRGFGFGFGRGFGFGFGRVWWLTFFGGGVGAGVGKDTAAGGWYELDGGATKVTRITDGLGLSKNLAMKNHEQSANNSVAWTATTVLNIRFRVSGSTEPEQTGASATR
jgi:hypothetical protein